MQNENEIETDLDIQYNQLVQTVKMTYKKSDCLFKTDKFSKFNVKRTTFVYNFESFVQEIYRKYSNELEKTYKQYDLKGDIQYLDDIVDKLFNLRCSIFAENKNDYKGTKLFMMRLYLLEYRRKLIWYFLPTPSKIKYLKLILKSEYKGSSVSKNRVDDFIKYLIDKYVSD